MDRAVRALLHDHVHLSHVWKASDATSVSITTRTFAICIFNQIQYIQSSSGPRADVRIGKTCAFSGKRQPQNLGSDAFFSPRV
jgi:hypothetical protein